MRKVLIVSLLLVALLLSACAQATPTPAPKPTEAPKAAEVKPTDAPTQVPPTKAPAKVEPTKAAPTKAAPTAAPAEVKPTDAPKPAAGMLPVVDPAAVAGDIVTAGSSTVFPLSEKIAERFQDEGYKGKITIDSIGSGAGYERFCKTGETDIANASRAIKKEEVENAAKIGREPIEFRIGTDALAVVVSKENKFIKDATKAQLAAIFSTATKWSDVDASWPAEEIKRFIPGTDSGTFDYFVEDIYKKDKKPILEAKNTQMSEDDNVLVQGVLGSPYAIGFFGYAYYVENADKLNVLSVEGVTPNKESVDAAKYPLARPLFLYSDAKIMQEKPQVASFIAYYLTHVNEEISEVGYFPAPEAALKVSMENWLKAMGK